MRLLLNFVSACYGFTVITKEKNTWPPLDFCEWVVYIYFIYFFINKNQILKGKNGLVRHINGLAPETEEFIHPILHLGFHWLHHLKKRSHRDSTFLAQSPTPLEIACTIEL